MPNERFWRFVIVAVLVAAALTACYSSLDMRYVVARANCQARGENWLYLADVHHATSTALTDYRCVHVDSVALVADTLTEYAHVR